MFVDKFHQGTIYLSVLFFEIPIHEIVMTNSSYLLPSLKIVDIEEYQDYENFDQYSADFLWAIKMTQIKFDPDQLPLSSLTMQKTKSIGRYI